MEVRLQEHQVDRTDSLSRATAGRGVATRGSTRVRILRERQSNSRSSTLEPGEGSQAAGFLPQSSNGNVQWLWRSGREPLCRHGPEAEFLEESPNPTVLNDQFLRRVLKPLIFVSALTPAGYLVWAALAGNLSANPLGDVTNGTGDWALRFLCITLAITPLRRVSGWNGAIKFRRMLGLFAFLYGGLHFLTYVILDRFAGLDLSEMNASWMTLRALAAAVSSDIYKRPFIGVGF